MRSSLISDLEPGIRRNLVMALVILIALFVGVALAATLYEAELRYVALAIYRVLGLPGLFAILFVSDAVFSPIPPDLVLVVLSQTRHDEYWLALAVVIGMQSVLAGCTGWLLASRLAESQRFRVVLQRVRKRHQGLVLRHGRLGIAIAALTPIPFSLTCWAAGMLKMPFRSFLFPCWLRIPRFVAYYAAITYADQLGHWLR